MSLRLLQTIYFQKSANSFGEQIRNLITEAQIKFMNNPSHPSLRCHRLHKLKKNTKFWSMRVNDDLRIIYWQEGQAVYFCYVDHHDAAYTWAQNNQFTTNPVTGAIQIIASEEIIEHHTKTIYQEEHRGPRVFQKYDDSYLLKLGVPQQWLEAVKHVDVDEFFDLAPQLPEEARENLLSLASGTPVATPIPFATENPYEHPDSRRRVTILDASEHALRAALMNAGENWAFFLHPSQQSAVDKSYSGPARVTGGAGTGKTVVALHRCKKLAAVSQNILLTTYSRTLAKRLSNSLDTLMMTGSERNHVQVVNLHQLARQLYESHSGKSFQAIEAQALLKLIKDAMQKHKLKTYDAAFVLSEYQHIIDAYGIDSFPEYRNLKRTGRGYALGVAQRLELWRVFKDVQETLKQKGQMSFERLCHETIKVLPEPPFEHIVADESQDFGPAELMLLRALVAEAENDLFLAGDIGQRIYKRQTAFSRCGISIKGRSRILKINYRTTEQIRQYADRILPAELQNEEGESEARHSISLLSGPAPHTLGCKTTQDEIYAVADYIKHALSHGMKPSDIALFARTQQLLKSRAEQALLLTGQAWEYLSDDHPVKAEHIALGTMHKAKGLEFRLVIVMGAEASTIPNPIVLASAPNQRERQSLLEQERNLMYVACSRAREQLVISWIGLESNFLPG